MTKSQRLAVASYGFAIAIIIVDQITKAWVLNALQMLGPDGGLIDREMWVYRSIEVLPPIFKISFVLNDGVSFGLFGGGSARWVLTIFSLGVAGLLSWWALQSTRRLLTTAIGFIIGGALGNVIDRIRFGGVVDFLNFEGLHFPWVFNVADSAIFIGVCLLILDSLMSERGAAKVGAAHEKS